MNHQFMRVLFLLFISVLMGACNQDQQSDVELQREQARDIKLDEMQQELRLLVKEMVVLNTKLDALAAKQASANNAREVPVKKSIELPPLDKRLGSKDAQYAIVEFMDYQCPYCVRYAKQTLPTLKQRYIDNGQLQYVIRDYPLSFHSKAEGAAIAANCAGEQGKYWLMHKQLVQNSRKLGDDLYKQLAQDIGLDVEVFSQCQTKPEMQQAVQTDFEYGSKVGTRGTPNFYIGKIEGDKIVDAVQISGARPIEAFDKVIQQVMRSGS